jgi:hypothetical protein
VRPFSELDTAASITFDEFVLEFEQKADQEHFRDNKESVKPIFDAHPQNHRHVKTMVDDLNDCYDEERWVYLHRQLGEVDRMNALSHIVKCMELGMYKSYNSCLEMLKSTDAAEQAVGLAWEKYHGDALERGSNKVFESDLSTQTVVHPTTTPTAAASEIGNSLSLSLCLNSEHCIVMQSKRPLTSHSTTTTTIYY